MLKHRVITACALAIILLWAIFFWPQNYFLGLLAIVAFVSAWEWSRMCGLRSSVYRGAYMLFAGAASLLAAVKLAEYAADLYISGLGSVFWLIATAFLLRGKSPPFLGDKTSVARMALAVPLFTIVIWGLLWLRDSAYGSPLLLIYVFCIVWLADIGAYFAGRRWGKRKLSPNISPGKSVEGALGGVAAVMIWAVLFVFAGPFPFDSWVLLTASLIAGVLSISGDLLESYMKRSVAIKDSGSILPGHGGILDRIDSVLAAVPVFVFLIVLLNLRSIPS